MAIIHYAVTQTLYFCYSDYRIATIHGCHKLLFDFAGIPLETRRLPFLSVFWAGYGIHVTSRPPVLYCSFVRSVRPFGSLTKCLGNDGSIWQYQVPFA